MKYKEIQNLSREEIENKLLEVQNFLRKVKFENAISPVENSHLIKENRRLIAKFKTKLNESKTSKII